MAVPKSKISKSKTRSQRRTNMKMGLPKMTACPECGGLTPPHKVCVHCGNYKGRQVVEVNKG